MAAFAGPLPAMATDVEDAAPAAGAKADAKATPDFSPDEVDQVSVWVGEEGGKTKARGPGNSNPRAADPRPPTLSISSLPHFTQIRSALLAWYDRSHRILPWRRNPHSSVAGSAEGGARLDAPLNEFAYGVWVCEVMSQQTQLERVKAYWTAWMARWPTVEALAAASEEDVRAAWAGLGYYRRARFLLEGARQVVSDLGGRFPMSVDGLRKIKGIGPYTASAIASIAGGVRSAVVDGNVVRVLARLRAVGGDPKTKAAEEAWARLADALVDPARPGDFNQAVMELGATVCVPAGAPACGACPVRSLCAARAGADAGGPAVTDFPGKAAKAKQRPAAVDVAVLELVRPESPGDPLVLLTQRPEGGLLAGLWEFPTVDVAVDGESGQPSVGPAARRAALDTHLARLLGRPLPPRRGGSSDTKGEEGDAHDDVLLRRAPVGELTHVFSHIRLALAVEHVVLSARGVATDPAPAVGEPGEAAYRPATRWVPASAMGDEPVSSSVAKCWRLAASGGGAARSSTKRSAVGGGSGPLKAGGPPPPGGGIKRFFQVKPAAAGAPPSAGGGGGGGVVKKEEEAEEVKAEAL
jgi:A/G-specific adenine glycosylase